MNIIHTDKSKSIAFTGHRTISASTDAEQLRADLLATLAQAYNNGFRACYVGAAQGFDLLAAEAVLELQKIYSDIQLFCVVPYAGHHRAFDREDKLRYIDIADRATSNIILSSQYYDGCFLRRNDYMIHHSSLLIAYHDGAYRSGTAYTVRRAKANSIPVINLYNIK
ncbi:putative phage-like protein YoqJ [Dysgonomonas alginatilytica]|uniref:Putative phage-like protein YoqJ n=1 Tax=Dysgonomonas alginatilytica TaxID=1605892 RepID=A0A2V3PLJ2_9BACT|nr:SLOG family protein [Dysgonomonas alginatilytica]PXV62705.1 putative phage-like protein YoqJ [Dysgonomonas alginatilytica]